MRRIFIALLVTTPLFAATRLPQNVIPDHYTIAIAPDLANETFSGEETIDVEVKEPVDTITLHSIDLNLKDVRVGAVAPQLTFDAPNETVTLKLPETIPAGRTTLHFTFDAKLGQQLRGLYLSKTAKRKYAVTQFEAMSARHAFPSFDEPAMKAAFDITLTIDNGDTAISNGAIVSDTPAGGGAGAPPSTGKHTIKFATSTKMSTYLVAMLVGDFQCISGSADDVPIRVCTTPGLQQLGHFALDAAEASIKFFDAYYGIRYPFVKLDLIGIPDFAAGAMENAGAITFRETDLLVDDKIASVIVKKRVAEVVAHEIAHQWFGDLVTMKWWDDIWLNEGFATFMSQKPIEAWKPEWRIDLEKPVATNEALVVDSTKATQAIRTPANAEGGGAFGNAGIIYGKTASVLRMVEQWIGADAFRDAIRVYLKKYSWSNAAAEDFWSTMKASSSQPTDVVLESFIDLTGEPLLHVGPTTGNGTTAVTISQERLLPRGQSDGGQAAAPAWKIPICPSQWGAGDLAGGSTPCALLTESKTSLLLPTSERHPLFLSRNGSGYFVADYAKSDRDLFRAHLDELSPAQRISYNGTEWLLTRTMHRDAGEYLQLALAMPRAADRPLVTAIADNLIYLDQRLVNDSNRAAWQKVVHDALRGHARATWTAPPAETAEQRISRASVLWTLGTIGRDPDVIAGARKVASQYMKDLSSVDAVIAERALRLSAVHGDGAFLNRVIEQLEKAPSPEIANRYRNLLPYFRDPEAIARATDYIYSDRIRTQDLPAVASAMFIDPATRANAWSALKAHWAGVEKRAPASLGRISGATSNFCDADSRKEVEAFITAHPTRGSQRVLARVLDSIDTCIAFRNAQQTSFNEGLARR
jgi:aminopeptidase N/puromycin-sensitive aminopeptidase